MTGPASEKAPRPDSRRLSEIFPPSSLHTFLNLETRHNLTSDDRWHDDPERQRLYLVHGAASYLHSHFRHKSNIFSSLPADSREVFATGQAGPRIMPFFMTALSTAAIPALRTQTEDLLTSMEQLVHEKGFRPRADIHTPGEHAGMGSTIGKIFTETDPDVPVSILRGRLIAAGRIDPYEGETAVTVEEIDKARRLSGMTTLNIQTGRATNQVDPRAAFDSYFFLSPGRKTEIIRQEDVLVASAEQIAISHLEEFARGASVISALDSYSKGVIPIGSLKKIYKEVVAKTSGKDEKTGLDLDTYIDEVRGIAFSTGTWDRILTPQEILLRVGGEVDERYLAKPYTPLAIQDGEPIDEIAQLRNDEGSMQVPTSILEYNPFWHFRLEEIDQTGSTTQSPAILKTVNEEVGQDIKDLFGPRITMPFVRPEDWYYHEER